MSAPALPKRPRVFRVGRVCAEAARNRLARLWLTLALIITWSGAALVVYVSERDAAISNAAYTSSMRKDGYATQLISQADHAAEPFTWANCQTLRLHHGVEAVVGMREPVTMRLWNQHGPEVVVREAMGDVAGFLSSANRSRALRWNSPAVIFDTSSLAARPNATTAAALSTQLVSTSNDTSVRRAATESLSSFGRGFSGNAIMLTAPGGEIATCLVLIDLDKRAEVEAAIGGLFPAAAGFGQQWALLNAERFESPRDRYEQRDSRWYWYGAVALITLTWGLSLWMLRNDLAVFAVAGLGRWGLLGLVAVELFIVGCGAALATLGVAAFDVSSQPGLTSFVSTAFSETGRVAVASAGTCIAIAVATTGTIARRTLDTLKDR